MPAEYRISFIIEKCVGCHGCEVACKSWRNVETGIRWRKVSGIWDGKYPDLKLRSLSMACMHCEEPACVSVCPEGAIEKRREDGIVVVDPDACTGCRACADACPVNIPEFGTDDKMQKCDLCIDRIDMDSESPPCAATCPTKALIFIKLEKDERKFLEKSLLENKRNLYS